MLALDVCYCSYFVALNTKMGIMTYISGAVCAAYTWQSSMTKLSKLQQELIDLMASGWQLSHWDGVGKFNAGYSLQHGGRGKGGEIKRVLSTTVTSMKRAGLIVVDHDGYPTQTFKLATEVSAQ